MVSKRVMSAINFSLALISFLLILNLFGVTLPNLGYTLFDKVDTSEEVCFTAWQDNYNELNMNLCCHDVRKQLVCENHVNEIDGIRTDILCYTGETTVKHYLNSKAYRECTNYYD
jgi:hypothetical protein